MFLIRYPNIPTVISRVIACVHENSLTAVQEKEQIKMEYGSRTATFAACCFCYHCSYAHDHIGFLIVVMPPPTRVY